MAKVTVAHKPELTAEGAMEVFRSHFAGKYDVYKMSGLGRLGQGLTRTRDFVVKKSGWTGVGVGLEQEPNATTFVFTPFMPSPIFTVLLGGLISYLFLRPSWKALEEEVGSFIENAAAFK